MRQISLQLRVARSMPQTGCLQCLLLAELIVSLSLLPTLLVRSPRKKRHETCFYRSERGRGGWENGGKTVAVSRSSSPSPTPFSCIRDGGLISLLLLLFCGCSVFLLYGYWSTVLSIPVTLRGGCALYASIWSLGNAAVAAVRLHPVPRNRHRWLCSHRTCYAASVQQASRIWRRYAANRRRRSSNNSSACVASVASSVAIRRWWSASPHSAAMSWPTTWATTGDDTEIE